MTAAIAEKIDWSSLSPQAQATLRALAIPLSAGYSRTDVAKLVRPTTPSGVESDATGPSGDS